MVGFGLAGFGSGWSLFSLYLVIARFYTVWLAWLSLFLVLVGFDSSRVLLFYGLVLVGFGSGLGWVLI